MRDPVLPQTVLPSVLSRMRLDIHRYICNAWFGLETRNVPDAVNRYLSFFSRFPSMSTSSFSPMNSPAPFPLSLSPSIVSL